MARQAPNVARMRLFGARVVAVEAGQKTLKEAVNEALRAWAARCDKAHYILGSALGPHPFPLMVRTFQSVIGEEARAQALEAGRRAARRGGGLRRRRQQRPGPHGAVPGRPGAPGGGGGRRPRHGRGRARGAHLRRPDRGAARLPQPPAAGRARLDRRDRQRQRGPGLPLPGPGTGRPGAWPGGWKAGAHRTARPWPRPGPWPAPKASCRPWNPATPWPYLGALAESGAATVLLGLSGRGDKDLATFQSRLEL